MEVLQAVWQHGPSTVRQVHEALSGSRAVVYTTTLKIMQLMIEKGLLTRDGGGERAHRYSAVPTREETRQSVVRTLIDRVFGGSGRELVLSALGSGTMSCRELSAIRKALADSEENPREKGGGK